MRIDLAFKAASGMPTYATSLKLTRISENYFGKRVRMHLLVLQQLAAHILAVI